MLTVARRYRDRSTESSERRLPCCVLLSVWPFIVLYFAMWSDRRTSRKSGDLHVLRAGEMPRGFEQTRRGPIERLQNRSGPSTEH